MLILEGNGMENLKNSEVNKLKDQLFMKRRNGGAVLSDDELKDVFKFAENYKTFLDSSKTEREAVSYVLKLAKQKGFKEFDCNAKYGPGDKIYYVNRERSLVLAVIGKNGMKNGARLSVAHIDSPRLDLKPNPLYESNELALFKTHYYGGIKKYQWTAIPLSLHGRVIRRDGSVLDVCLGEDQNDPCFCVTDLLPHLAKEQMNKTVLKAFTGEDLNVLIGSLPFKSDEGSELVKLNIMKLINEKYGLIESDFVSAELELVPTFKAKDIGFDRSMIGGYGHDDRVCAYPCVEAIFNCENPEDTVMTVLADKEEIGSDGNTGMKSAFIKYFIADLASKEGLKCRNVLRKCKCLSADVNAAFDPTYKSAYEEANSAYINRGVVITKYTGSGGKGDTSDASAEYMGEVRRILDSNEVLWQTGELGKVDGGGGGTIAKYMAQLDMDVVDLGVPVLSMHAPFEVISKIDLYMAYRAVGAFFK